ncbi:MAG: hypothetical protein M1834_000502 [Cirrosporium novae-zelandiae]|nr:MAG: hypothetical protein M1834_000502 [Cirrosporium novae-zelandiae]
MKLSISFLPFFSLLLTVAALNTPANDNFLGTTPEVRYVMNQTQAQIIVNAAKAQATKIGVPSCIAVCDPSGYLVAFLRMDNAFLGSIDISIKKAKTVSLFNGGFSTAALYNKTQPGGSLYGIEDTNNGLVVFGGGVPVFLDLVFIGSVGVSGGTPQQDINVAETGVNSTNAIPW